MAPSQEKMKPLSEFEDVLRKIQKLTNETSEEISAKVAGSKYYVTQTRSKSRNYKNGMVGQSAIDKMKSHLKIVELSIQTKNKEDEILALQSNAIQTAPPLYAAYPYVSAESISDYLAAVKADRLSDLNLPTMLLQKELDNGHHAVFETTNDAMWDGTDRSISKGDKVLAKEFEKEFWGNTSYYRKYLFLFVRRDGIVCQQILNYYSKTESFMVQSFNPTYPKFSLNTSDVLKVFYVKKIVERIPTF